ncbi:hypothetical protein WJX72_007502 [[Myrmecia] bisecta]|uniref:Glycerophosphocholine acyltransferase 1 n=1 Tax=[Myrmecia] bisecta TaxID=41462 RepID=A0AAW1P9S4_9CHLO
MAGSSTEPQANGSAALAEQEFEHETPGFVETLAELGDFRLGEAFEGQPEHADRLDDYDEMDVGDMGTYNVKDLTLFRAHLREVLAKQITPGKILLRDKVAFVLGTVLATLSAYWLGCSPTTFYRAYTIEAVILFTLRFIIYRAKKWHYYMMDFCYVANVLLLVHIWFYPHLAWLHKVTFAFASGPLAWSVVAFRNSLVFHSLDKITSLFLHWVPACLVWTARWHPDLVELNSKSHAAREEWLNASLWQLVAVPLAPYLTWAVLYYAKIFIVSSNKIKARGYETLYNYSTSNPRSAITRVVHSVSQPLQPVVYMVLHITYTALTFALCKVWWNSYWAHTTFLLIILMWSAWNGASYYFEVFAHRYVAALGLPDKRHKPAPHQDPLATGKKAE